MSGDTLTMEQVRAELQRFANAHKLVFEDCGTVGFGRPCVGFTHGDQYIAHNPRQDGGDYDRIAGFADDRLYPPAEVSEAYHKHDCLAVLAHTPDDGDTPDYDAALRQLYAWVQHIESIGPVEVAPYETGATGFQALLSGVIGYALRFTDGGAA